MYEVADRVYMLHFVGCNILVDKSYIDAKYMWLFSNLDHVRWAYAWARGGAGGMFKHYQLRPRLRELALLLPLPLIGGNK